MGRVRRSLRNLVGHALVVSCCVAFVGGCAPKKPPDPRYAARLTAYRRLAIVCAPGPGADPTYAETVLRQVESMAPSRLDFLDRVDVLRDVPVDASAVPPRVKMESAEYDGIVTLIYSYPGPVLLDMYMLDARDRAEVWHYQLSTNDKDVPGRLERHGYWTPTKIKQQFYGRD